jgi:flagellar basal body rod protein FlgB
MSSSGIVIDLASWAMRLEQTRAQSASYNIATANVSGSRPLRVDFAAQLKAVHEAVALPNASSEDLASVLRQDFALESQPFGATAVALDEEVANLTESEIRYKTLAEALSRQFALLTLSASGKQ